MYKINWFSSCLNFQAYPVCLASLPTQLIVAAWLGWWSIKSHRWSWSIAKRSSVMLRTLGSMLRLRKPIRSRCMCGQHSSILDQNLYSSKVSFGLKRVFVFLILLFFEWFSELSLSRTFTRARDNENFVRNRESSTLGHWECKKKKNSKDTEIDRVH